MTRALYSSLLRLHPPAFRRRFGTEMLWIFDEAQLSEGALVLLLDLLISVMRQWLLRSGVWKAALALALGAIQVTVGGFGWLFFNPRITANQGGAKMTPITPMLDDLMRVTLWSFGIVFVAVFVSTLWIGRFNRGRLKRGTLAPRRRH